MQLLFTGLSNAVLQAVSRVLIHSLWQGLVAAVMAALIVSFTKRSAASVRYNLLLTVLAIFVLCTGITAARAFQSVNKENDEAIATNNPGGPSAADHFETGAGMVKPEAATRNLAEQFSVYCNEHATMIVMIWFLLFLMKCGQLLASIRYIQRVRHRNNYEVSGYWKDQLGVLCQKAGITKAVLFLESEMVKVPAVIGFLKPVLLVPVGLLAHLPPEQVEAILLHELAHIHRRDLLANLLQSVIEAFFFFNPAIVWISSLIREEREACCDDLVVAHIPQKANYLQALVFFQELQLYPKAGSIALTGHKHYLFNRVRRMLTMENKKLNLMEKTVLILSILGITAFGFITRQSGEKPVVAKHVKSENPRPTIKQPEAVVPVVTLTKPGAEQKRAIAVTAVAQPYTDTLPKTKGERSFPSISSNTKNDGNNSESQVDATDNEGKHYSIKRVDGQIKSLTVNGTVIPQDQYGEYSQVIGQIDEAQRQRLLKRKEDLELRKADLLVKQKQMQEKRKELAVANQKELSQKLELIKEIQIENNLKKDELIKLYEQKNELRKIEYDLKKVQVVPNEKLYNQKRAEVIQNENLYHQKKVAMLQNQKLYNQKKAEILRSEKLLRQGSTGNDDISRIIADLNNQSLANDADHLSFTLTDKELVVNGKKQSSEIHQQFKEKYIQKSGDRFVYSKKGNATSITINKE